MPCDGGAWSRRPSPEGEPRTAKGTGYLRGQPRPPGTCEPVTSRSRRGTVSLVADRAVPCSPHSCGSPSGPCARSRCRTSNTPKPASAVSWPRPRHSRQLRQPQQGAPRSQSSPLYPAPRCCAAFPRPLTPRRNTSTCLCKTRVPLAKPGRGDWRGRRVKDVKGEGISPWFPRPR